MKWCMGFWYLTLLPSVVFFSLFKESFWKDEKQFFILLIMIIIYNYSQNFVKNTRSFKLNVNRIERTNKTGYIVYSFIQGLSRRMCFFNHVLWVHKTLNEREI